MYIDRFVCLSESPLLDPVISCATLIERVIDILPSTLGVLNNEAQSYLYWLFIPLHMDRES